MIQIKSLIYKFEDISEYCYTKLYCSANFLFSAGDVHFDMIGYCSKNIYIKYSAGTCGNVRSFSQLNNYFILNNHFINENLS